MAFDDDNPEPSRDEKERRRQSQDPTRISRRQPDHWPGSEPYSDDGDIRLPEDQESFTDRENKMENSLIHDDIDSIAEESERSSEDGWAYDDNDE